MGFILVVDDQEENRDMLSRRLVRNGYETITAENGTIALELIEKKEIDIVLLDIRMPGMDGNQVLEKIRINHSPAELPVIMVTAETGSVSEIKSIGLGADDYITKPIDFPVLLARLKNKLALKAMVKEKISDGFFNDSREFSKKEVTQLIEKGENQKLEFKSTLRWNIHSGRTGREIETAWLKTIVAFLNTDGGVLLAGVSDEGNLGSLALDNFKNDDRLLLYINTSIKERIGLEFISNIFYNLVTINNEKVLVIQSKPTTKAVFLKNEKEDEFYARFGPSSRKLSAKEVLDYITNKPKKE